MEDKGKAFTRRVLETFVWDCRARNLDMKGKLSNATMGCVGNKLAAVEDLQEYDEEIPSIMNIDLSEMERLVDQLNMSRDINVLTQKRLSD